MALLLMCTEEEYDLVIAMCNDQIKRLADKWKLKWPKLTQQIDEGLEIVESTRKISHTAWESKEGNITYYVCVLSLKKKSMCTCRSILQTCRHKIAVALQWSSLEIPESLTIRGSS